MRDIRRLFQLLGGEDLVGSKEVSLKLYSVSNLLEGIVIGFDKIVIGFDKILFL